MCDRLLGVCNKWNNKRIAGMTANPYMDNPNMKLDEALEHLKDLLDDMDDLDNVIGCIVELGDKMDAVRYAINKLEVLRAAGGR